MDARLPPPTRLGRYRVLRELGRGGMGAVYLCQDPELDRQVAVKLLAAGGVGTPAVRDAARRLRDEAQAAARVRHPGLVALIDSGEDPDLGPFLVYELMPGGSLRAALARGPFGWEAAFERVGRPLLGALDALHRAGVTHRDVKPENLLGDERGSFRLADLGLALFTGRAAKTATGIIYGTPGYLPPECYGEGRGEAPGKLDGYSAALTLVEAATGRLPWIRSGAEAVQEQMTRVLEAGDLARLGLPGPVAARLAEALAAAPAARRAEPALLLAELGELGEVQVRLPRPAPGLVDPRAPLPTVVMALPSAPAPGRARSVPPLVPVGLLGLALLAGVLARPGPSLPEPGPGPAGPGASPAEALALRPLTPAALATAARNLARRARDPATDLGVLAEDFADALAVLGRAGDDPGGAAARRSALDAALDATLDAADGLPEPAFVLVGWSLLHGDLSPTAVEGRIASVRQRLLGSAAPGQPGSPSRPLLLGLLLLQVELLVRDRDLPELAACGPALGHLLADPCFTPEHRRLLAAWLPGVVRRLGAMPGSETARAALPGRLPAPVASPVAQAQALEAAMVVAVPELKKVAWDLPSELGLAAALTSGRLTDRARSAYAQLAALGSRLLWLARVSAVTCDPVVFPRGLEASVQACSDVYEVFRDLNYLTGQILTGRMAWELASGDETNRLALGCVVGLARASRQVRASKAVSRAWVEDCLLVSALDWISRIRPWDHPDRAAWGDAVLPLLDPTSLAYPTVKAWLAFEGGEPLPSPEDCFALWDRAEGEAEAAGPRDPGFTSMENWGVFREVSRVVYACLRRDGRSGELGARLARLDDRFVIPPGVQSPGRDWCQILLLYRADSALAGGRTAELAGLQQRLQSLAEDASLGRARMAKNLLAGTPLPPKEP